MAVRKAPTPLDSLASLRAGGRATQLLFLYEATMRPHTRLRSLAQVLGVTVQSASLIFRDLQHAGLVESGGGRYRPTVAGTAFLQDSMHRLRDDLEKRIARLKVVRRCQAIAGARIRKGESVRLAMRDGLLTAFPGVGHGSVGRAEEDAQSGELVAVDELRGIVPLEAGRIVCFVLPTAGSGGEGAVRTLRAELRTRSPGLMAADGLEATHLLGRVTPSPFVRFGVAAAARDASRLGVEVFVLVTEERLAPFVTELQERGPSPDVEFHSLADQVAGAGKRASRGRRPSTSRSSSASSGSSTAPPSRSRS